MAQNLLKESSNVAFEKLAAKAGENKNRNLNYAGDISCIEAFKYVSENPSVIVDVRTIFEWLTGVPDISATPSKLLKVSWKTTPSYAINPDFIDEVSRDSAIDKDSPIFFICRSGGRSLDAALAMTEAGYKYCFNIAGGFEGDTDASGYRGSTGWKHDNLPWVQG